MITTRAVKWVFCLCLIPEIAESQSVAPVRGRIVAADSAPVAGALVELVNATDSARTSATGEFLFARVAAGKQVLRVRMLGFKIRLEEILVDAKTGWSGTIALEPSPVELPAVEVTSSLDKPAEFANTAKYDDFFRRRKLGIGSFRTRADIDAKASYDLVSVLQGIPSVGVSMTPGGYAEVSPQIANEMILDSRQVVILDIRPAEAFRGPAGHIAGALSAPFDTIERQLPELLPYQGQTVLVYGENSTDGALAARLLTLAGFRNVVHVNGGLEGWIAHGYRTVNAQ